MNKLRLANCIFLCLLILCSSIPYAFLSSATNADDQLFLQYGLEDAQRPVRIAAFGSTYSDQYIRLSLLTSPIEFGEVAGFGPSGEPITWNTAYLAPEMFSDPEANQLTPDQIEELDSISAQAHLVVGTLSGPSGSVNMVAMYMSVTDAGGVRYHHLLPVGEASVVLIDVLTEMTEVVSRGRFVLRRGSPCDSPTHCHDLYRQRIADALKDFSNCMKGQVPVVSLCAVACFILCAPFLLGTPVAYAVCVVACLAGCSGIGVIDWQTCEAELEAASENAVSSYTICIAWKEANCQPYDWEVDIVNR